MLKEIKSPENIKKLSYEELKDLAKEIRELIIKTIKINGGHLGSSLGAVEIILAVHKVFNAPEDKIIFDVGHQAYAHKIITGRYEKFNTIRKKGGLSGFTNRFESEYDHFTAGHAGPSISTALGISEANKLQEKSNKVIAIIGDGSMSSGISFEGLNNAGANKNDIIIILNENKMSIAKNVGALSKWLSNAVTGSKYHSIRKTVKEFLLDKGIIGDSLLSLAHRFADGTKAIFTPGILFEGLGFQYIGPIDGHDIEKLSEVLNDIKELNEPVLLHVLTQKGKGYKPSEDDPSKYHGISPKTNKKSKPKWTNIFSETLVELAKEHEDIVAITAAMPNGTGLDHFYRYFPKRFYDVGIAEQHAVAFAAGLANEGIKPFVAIYSTFIQRAYDQIFHDVILQKLNVVFILDRAGLVGEDGATHHGVYDLSFMRVFPDIVIMTPKDGNELRNMLYTAYHYKNGPIVIRFPRGEAILNKEFEKFKEISIGSFTKEISFGRDYLILSSGWLNKLSIEVATEFNHKKIRGEVINVRFIKPLDEKMLHKLFKKHKKIITIEENSIVGGMGSAILEWANDNGYKKNILRIAVEDNFIEHATQSQLRVMVGLEKKSIIKKIKKHLRLF